jgi:hypothetical protein
MASFMRSFGTQKNGKSTAVNGRRNNRTSDVLFIRCAVECNGDIRKMGDESHLKQPAQQILSRYKNMLKKDKRTETGEKLPPIIFELQKERVTMTDELAKKIQESWNKNGGDVDLVAKDVGIAAATINYHVKKWDEDCLQKNVQFLIGKYKIKGDGEEVENGKTADEKAIEILNANGGYVSVFCEKKMKQRVRQSASFDNKLIGELDSIIADQLAEIDLNPPKTGTEKLMEHLAEEMVAEEMLKEEVSA